MTTRRAPPRSPPRIGHAGSAHRSGLRCDSRPRPGRGTCRAARPPGRRRRTHANRCRRPAPCRSSLRPARRPRASSSSGRRDFLAALNTDRSPGNSRSRYSRVAHSHSPRRRSLRSRDHRSHPHSSTALRRRRSGFPEYRRSCRTSLAPPTIRRARARNRSASARPRSPGGRSARRRSPIGSSPRRRARAGDPPGRSGPHTAHTGCAGRAPPRSPPRTLAGSRPRTPRPPSGRRSRPRRGRSQPET